MHRETPIYRQQFFGSYGPGADLPLESAIYFQYCISVTFESTFYFYLLKQIFGTTFYFLKSRIFGMKVAKSSTFDNTAHDDGDDDDQRQRQLEMISGQPLSLLTAGLNEEDGGRL